MPPGATTGRATAAVVPLSATLPGEEQLARPHSPASGGGGGAGTPGDQAAGGATSGAFISRQAGG
eukprot:9451543-Lingulodinium_polyedra.AAC.1